jgi:hypothetical protein
LTPPGNGGIVAPVATTPARQSARSLDVDHEEKERAMSLEEKLAPLREATAKRVGPEMHAVMQNATRQLRESGILDRVIKPGIPAPDFTLNDQNNAALSLAGLLATGAVVVSVFRGFW